MKRSLAVVLLGLALSAAGCGPLTSIACDRVGAHCANVDLAACDAMMLIVPPHVRTEILDCTAAAKSCDEAVYCFSSRGYYLPTSNPYRY
jgi:hypothetical protein